MDISTTTQKSDTQLYPEATEQFAKDILQKAYPEYKKPEQKPFIVANCKRLNIRKGPSKNALVLVELDKGTKLLVGEISDTGWAHVSIHDGTEGYAMREFLKEV